MICGHMACKLLQFFVTFGPLSSIAEKIVESLCQIAPDAFVSSHVSCPLF